MTISKYTDVKTETKKMDKDSYKQIMDMLQLTMVGLDDWAQSRT